MPMLDGYLGLSDKYQVASAADVFLTPFYWQLHEYLDTPPALIVDCGAHCGHFTALAESCIRYRFGKSECRYVLVEADSGMVRRARRTVAGLGIESRVTIENAILGAPDTSDNATLWINRSNPLSSSLSRSDGARPVRARRADLRSIVGAEQIDILKVDIEGAEFALVEAEAATLGQARILFLEVHAAPRGARDRLIASLMDQGFHIRRNDLFAGNEHVLLTKR